MTDQSEIVEEVRSRAAAIDAQFGGDLAAYCRHLRDAAPRQAHPVVDQPTVAAAQHVVPSASSPTSSSKKAR